MSCRQSYPKAQNIALLPQFNVPPGVTDFAIENKPPHLPPRNSPSRVCVLVVGTVLCLVGSYSTISAAAGPVITQSNKLVSGMTNVMGNAILRANEEAERRAQLHYEARSEYMSRRRLSPYSSGIKADVDTAPLTTSTTSRTYPPRPKPALLARMAALRKANPASTLDETTIEQLFPQWVKHKRDGVELNERVVLQDLIMAVAQLSYVESVETRDGAKL